MAGRRGKRQKNQKGFTLLEFLVAVLILSIGLLGMGTLTGSMMNFNRVAFKSTKAVTLAQDKMEELKGTSYASLSGGNDSESIYTRTWTVAADTPDDDMTTVTVTVTWTSAGDSKEIELKSIVAK